MNGRVRELTGDEWTLWRDLRLRALADSPDAFRATHAEEAGQPDEWWEDLIGDTVAHPRGGLWIAEIDEEPVGMAFGRLDPACQVLGIGAMWVAPGTRAKGIGARLLAAAMDWGRSIGARVAELWVTDGNEGASSLYRSAGFIETDERELLRPGSNLTVTKLTADLSEPSGGSLL